MKLHIFQGPALSGKTKRILEEMEKAHLENPLSYTFIGPSGLFVKEWADWFARHLNSSIPRSNFLVLDQFAVELYRSSHPDQIHVDEYLLSVFIAEIILSLEEEELGSIALLKDSPGLLRQIAEAVIEARDNGEKALLKKISNIESRSLVLTILNELKIRCGDKIFDTFDAYQKIDPQKVQSLIGSRFGNKLFIDGFMNFSRAHMIFLSRIIPEFDQVFLTLDTNVLNIGAWKEFMDMLPTQSIEIIEESFQAHNGVAVVLEAFLTNANVPEKTDFLEGFANLAVYKDPEEELIGVCRKIKRRIVDGKLAPGEIAIVLNNFSERSREFYRKLEEYGVPARMEGDEPISESVAVQLLILPLKTAQFGYPPEMLISMLDHGLGLFDPVEFDLEDLIGLCTDAGLYMGSKKASLEDRRCDWMRKLDEHLLALERKRGVIQADESVFEREVEDLEYEIQHCLDIKIGVGEIFESMTGIEDARLFETDLDQYMQELDSWISPLKIKVEASQELEGEALAVKKFEEVLKGLIDVLEAAGILKLQLGKFLTLLDILLNSQEYKASLKTANRVEILSLSAARFRHRSLKFIVNFNDDIFPARRCNSFYPLGKFTYAQSSANYYQQKEREQKEDFYSCLCTSSEVNISCPVASREGDPLVPSLWLDRLKGIPDKKDAGDVRFSPMSMRGLLVEYGHELANGVEAEVPTEALEFVEPLKRWSEESAFSWMVEDGDIAWSLVGKNFSYTKLSEFKNCPFKFYLKRMLGLKEPMNEGFDLTPLELGSVYHSALKNLYDWGQEVGKIQVLAREDDKIQGVVEEILERYTSANKVRSLPAVRSYLVDHVSSSLQGYLEFEMDTDKAFIGDRTLTELAFGINLEMMDSVLPGSAKKYGDLRLRGSIDRVDLNVTEKKIIYDAVVSDYKSTASSADWDQLKLYSLILLSMQHRDLPTDPQAMKAFFRIIKASKRSKTRISKRLDMHPLDARMELDTRPKSSLNFSDVDVELQQTLDAIFEQREFLPGTLAEGSKPNCYFCNFEKDCEGLIDRFR